MEVLMILQAGTDMPCVNFSDEMIAAYPNAKVILTTRTPVMEKINGDFHSGNPYVDGLEAP
jgi:hypothetical protein